MKTCLITIILTLCLGTKPFAQGCAYSGVSGYAGNLYDPSQLAVSIIRQSCNILNMPYINIYTGNIPNALATSLYNTPIIVYSPDFLNAMEYSGAWAPVSVLAHEVGHHYNGDMSLFGQFRHPWNKELMADYVSGYILYKLGAPLNDSLAGFRASFTWVPSESHPDSPRRAVALIDGWKWASYGN